MTKENKETLISTNDWEINGRILCISDIHQNVEWAKAVIALEKGNYDHIVFLGDFFDSFWEYPKVYTVSNTAKFIIEVIYGAYGPNTLLLGNHDLAYLEAWRSSSKFHNPKYLFNACSGYTNSKANEISKVLTWDNWKKFKLFALCNGWLLTHAGLRANNFRPFLDPKKSLGVLEQEFNEAVNHVNAFPHHLFVVGKDCGGPAEFGGPLWLRPDYFEDNEIPFPQIFGHTHTGKGMVKQYGRSFCIDGGQTSYCIIQPDGNIIHKSIRKMETNESGLEYPYVIEDARIVKCQTKSERVAIIDAAIAKLDARAKKEGKTVEQIIINEAMVVDANNLTEAEKLRMAELLEKEAAKKEKIGETIIFETPEEYLKRIKNEQRT